MSYLNKLGRSSSKLSPRNPTIGIDGNPEQPADTTRLVIGLTGFALLFCIYLYFYISPLIKDKNCVASYHSTKHSDPISNEDPEKGKQVDDTKTDEESDVADVLEKRRLREWLRRVSRGRFFVMKDEKPLERKKQKADKGRLYYRCRSKTSTASIHISPPPPAYASVPHTPIPIQIPQFPDLAQTSQEFSISSEEGGYSLPQRPAHVRFIPEDFSHSPHLRASLAQQFPSDSTISMDSTQSEIMTCDRSPSSRSSSGRIRTILPRDSTA